MSPSESQPPERPDDAGTPPATRGPAIPPAARERAVETLTRHFAADALSEEELEARLDRVYRAATPAELDAVVADLPAEPVPGDVAADAPNAGRPARPAQLVTATLSGVERSVTTTVPRELQVRARLGYVELDLTRALFQPGVTEIEVRATMGYVQLRLPGTVRVESDGRAFLGYFALRGGAALDPPHAASVVRLTGRAALGFVEAFPLRKPGESG